MIAAARHAAVLALLAPFAGAAAQEVSAAWEGGSIQRSGYADLRWPLRASAGGKHTLVLDGVFSRFSYEYPDFGAVGHLASSGIGASLGYRNETARTRTTLMAGYERRSSVWRSTGFTPESYMESGPTVDAEFLADVSPRTTLQVEASYERIDDVSLLRATLERRVGAKPGRARRVGTFVGGDVSVEANSDERAVQYGPAATIEIPSVSLDVDLRFGLAGWFFSDGSRKWRPHFGIALNWER